MDGSSVRNPGVVLETEAVRMTRVCQLRLSFATGNLNCTEAGAMLVPS